VALYDQVRKLIHTVVVYGAGITKAPEKLDCGSVKYETIPVYMENWDGEATYHELLEKLTRHAELDAYDQINLVLLPLMGKVRNRSEMAIEALKLAGRIEDEKRQQYLIACLIGISDKFLDDEYIEKFLEVFNMTRVFQEIFARGEAKGKAEGKIEGTVKTLCRYMEARFGWNSAELQEKIKTIAEHGSLDDITGKLFAANTLEEAQAIIRNSVKNILQ